MKHKLLMSVVAVAALLAAPAAYAQNYPGKPVKLVVPFPRAPQPTSSRVRLDRDFQSFGGRRSLSRISRVRAAASAQHQLPKRRRMATRC